MERSPDDYILVCFKKETYKECYSHIIFPPKGEKMRERTPYLDVLPPLDKKRSGRPKKKRTKDVNEKDDEANMKKAKLSKMTPTTVTSKGIAIKCSKCGQKGHNKTKCRVSIASSSVVGGSTKQAVAVSGSDNQTSVVGGSFSAAMFAGTQPTLAATHPTIDVSTNFHI